MEGRVKYLGRHYVYWCVSVVTHFQAPVPSDSEEHSIHFQHSKWTRWNYFPTQVPMPAPQLWITLDNAGLPQNCSGVMEP